MFEAVLYYSQALTWPNQPPSFVRQARTDDTEVAREKVEVEPPFRRDRDASNNTDGVLD